MDILLKAFLTGSSPSILPRQKPSSHINILQNTPTNTNKQTPNNLKQTPKNLK